MLDVSVEEGDAIMEKEEGEKDSCLAFGVGAEVDA